MAYNREHHRLVAATLVLLLLGPASLARAQSPSGAITGIVTDSSGAPLAGAQVSITNRDTRYVRIVATSTAGTFNTSALPPAEYTVSAEVQGFKRVERSARVEAGTTTTVDLALEVGDVRETVTVRGAAPLLRYDHHQVGRPGRSRADRKPAAQRPELPRARETGTRRHQPDPGSTTARSCRRWAPVSRRFRASATRG